MPLIIFGRTLLQIRSNLTDIVSYEHIALNELLLAGMELIFQICTTELCIDKISYLGIFFII